jgi:3,4-dihydroxy-9,10-secoandrosta-1,3,5(10)-triene-9,17-dione 4,5-dioxygenase
MGIRALGYLVIGTNKPETWNAFLTGIVGAMHGGSAADGASLYRIDERVFRFRIEPGEEERLLAAAYEVADAAALAELKGRVSAAGRPVTDGDPDEARARGVKAFFRTSDPAGHGLEFFHGHTPGDAPFVSPVGVTGFVTGEMGMGHVVYATPNFAAAHAFYRDVVGFGDTDIPRFHFSDDPGDPGMGFAFMHADNGRHHSVAIGEMPDPPSGCVHIMLEMQTMSDVGRCHDRMRLAGIPESATLGRHVNDQTFGFYMQTPSGFDLEIGCDPLVIDWQNWSPTAHLQPSEWGHDWAWQKAMREAEAAQ